MSEKFKITIDDVQAFLKTGGLMWDKTIITEQGKVPASKLKDISSQSNPVAIHAIDRSNNLVDMNISVDPISFLTYVQTFDPFDIDAVIEYEVENDLTNQWIKFLVDKYGKEYQDFAVKFCESRKRLLVLRTDGYLSVFEAEKRRLLDKHGEELAKYNHAKKFIYGCSSESSIMKK